MLVRYPILPYVTPRNKILFWNSEWVFMNKNHENNLFSARSRCFHRIIRKQKAAQLCSIKWFELCPVWGAKWLLRYRKSHF